MTIELAGVYRDYYLEVWTEALNLAGAPATSEWRKAEIVYYPKDLREAPEVASGLGMDVAPATIALEQLPTTQASFPRSETSKGPDKTSDQGRGWKWPRARRLAKVELSQRIKAKARKLKLCQRSRA